MSAVESAVIFQAVERVANKLGILTEKSKSIDELLTKLAQVIIKTEEEPDKIIDSTLKRLSSTKNSKPLKPTYEFKNPLDKDMKITGISFIPDSNFKTEGMIEIYIDDVRVYHNKTVADFTDISEVNVPLQNGKTIKRGKSVKIFLWNGTDTDAVTATVQVTFGE